MAFKVIKCNGESIPIINGKYLMTDAEGCTLGQGLTLTSGRLTNVAATATPEYIAQKTIAAAATSVEYVPVIRVTEGLQFEVNSMATVAATLRGSKVTLHTDGLLITATTGSGVFYVDETDGVTTTSRVRGKFRR
jgi:hypothetical protein